MSPTIQWCSSNYRDQWICYISRENVAV